MSEKASRFIPMERKSSLIIRDVEKCVHCGSCLDICMKNKESVTRYVQSDSTWNDSCVNCGQCIATCSEGALSSRSYIDEVKKHIADTKKTVIFSISPAVQAGLREAFKLDADILCEGQIIDALRHLGGDYVFDTGFSTDLSIIEEGTAFLMRLYEQKSLPVFTSRCPAFVKHMEREYPEKMVYLSSVKSPISIQGATIKTYVAEQLDLDSASIVNVIVTPCIAKKEEILRAELCDAGVFAGSNNIMDNDYVITTQELAEWIKSEKFDFKCLNTKAVYDNGMGRGSGAAVISENSGGVTEAVLRMLYRVLTGEAEPEDLLAYKSLRGFSQVKGAEVVIKELTLKVAVVYGLDAVNRLISGGYYKTFDFIEVMTCPGGCIGGAGQVNSNIKPDMKTLRKARMDTLYQRDEEMVLHNALDNDEIYTIYNNFYGFPLSALARQLLHTVR
ncbi:MAG: [Fe-Fe] hydrogenase large subunit C-terminal domain-containing protein [Eubacterium sp.]